MLLDLSSYLGLFLSAFLTATMLPGQSTLVLAAMIHAGDHPVWALVAVASVGNTLGACLNWWLGRYAVRFRDRQWFPVKAETLAKAEAWYRRYGRWSLLLSWAPIIGDPLTLAAGVLGEPLKSFVPLVALSKTVRYVIVAGLVLEFL